MNELKKLLYKHLSEDAVIVCAMMEEDDDNRFAHYKTHTKNGVLTKEGKAYNEAFEKRIRYHGDKDAREGDTMRNISALKKDLQKFQKHHPNINLITGPLKGLTKEECYAIRYAFCDHW